MRMPKILIFDNHAFVDIGSQRQQGIVTSCESPPAVLTATAGIATTVSFTATTGISTTGTPSAGQALVLRFVYKAFVYLSPSNNLIMIFSPAHGALLLRESNSARGHEVHDLHLAGL